MWTRHEEIYKGRTVNRNWEEFSTDKDQEKNRDLIKGFFLN